MGFTGGQMAVGRLVHTFDSKFMDPQQLDRVNQQVQDRVDSNRARLSELCEALGQTGYDSRALPPCERATLLLEPSREETHSLALALQKRKARQAAASRPIQPSLGDKVAEVLEARRANKKGKT